MPRRDDSQCLRASVAIVGKWRASLVMTVGRCTDVRGGGANLDAAEIIVTYGAGGDRYIMHQITVRDWLTVR